MGRALLAMIVAATTGCSTEDPAGPIAEDSCEAVLCGAPEDPVTLRVVDAATSAPVEGVTLTNLSVPASPPGSGGLSHGCTEGPGFTTCFVNALASGTYALDVTAPGYRTAHVEVEVPSWTRIPGVCCQQPWDAQIVDVRLSPDG